MEEDDATGPDAIRQKRAEDTCRRCTCSRASQSTGPGNPELWLRGVQSFGERLLVLVRLLFEHGAGAHINRREENPSRPLLSPTERFGRLVYKILEFLCPHLQCIEDQDPCILRGAGTHLPVHGERKVRVHSVDRGVGAAQALGMVQVPGAPGQGVRPVRGEREPVRRP